MKINWEALAYAIVGTVIGTIVVHMVTKKKGTATPPPSTPNA